MLQYLVEVCYKI